MEDCASYHCGFNSILWVLQDWTHMGDTVLIQKYQGQPPYPYFD